MYCSNCGAKIPEDGGFCPACGASVEETRRFVEAQSTEAAPPADSIEAQPSEAATPVETAAAAFAPPAADTTAVTFAPPAADTTAVTFAPPTADTAATAFAPPPADTSAVTFAPPTADTVVAAPEANVKKKSKKGIFITLGAVVLVALIVVGILVGYNVARSSNYDKALGMLQSGDYQGAYDTFGDLGTYKDSVDQQQIAQQNLDYLAAVALFDNKDYQGALTAFTAMGGFKDSADYVTKCQQNIDYLQAIDDYNNGNFDSALDTFSNLDLEGFTGASDWVDKTDYAIADKKFKDGDVYGAYLDFEALGSYSDAATRMKACTTPFPATGELYHNSKYVSDRSAITIDASASIIATYFKIYSGKTHVASFWVNAGDKITIELPPGNYTLKEAVGPVWFGEDIMFGDEGYYEIMLFKDNKDSYDLGDNVEATITLAADEGNMGTTDTDRTGF